MFVWPVGFHFLVVNGPYNMQHQYGPFTMIMFLTHQGGYQGVNLTSDCVNYTWIRNMRNDEQKQTNEAHV